LAVQRLCNRRGAAHLAQKQHFHLKVTAIVCHSQHVANPDPARSLGGLPIGLNPTEFTGSCGQCSRLEESGGPKPLVHSYVGHYLVLVTARALSLPLLSFPARTDYARAFFR